MYKYSSKSNSNVIGKIGQKNGAILKVFIRLDKKNEEKEKEF